MTQMRKQHSLLIKALNSVSLHGAAFLNWLLRHLFSSAHVCSQPGQADDSTNAHAVQSVGGDIYLLFDLYNSNPSWPIQPP